MQRRQGKPLTLFRLGLYCVAFAVYARIRGKKKGGGTNIVIYPLSLLFILCTIFCAVDTAQALFIVSGVIFGPRINPLSFEASQLRFEGTHDPQVGLSSYNMNILNTSMYCSITFIAQGILVCPSQSRRPSFGL